MGGSLLAQERYSAFGVQERHALPATTDQLYTGQRLNTMVGLYHYSDGTSAGRFYDPLLGRFVQPDPLRVGTGSQALNPYAYVLNNPLRLVDPSGHAARIDDPGGEWGSPVAVNAVYDDYLFGLFMAAYPDYDAHQDPVLTHVDETPWAYLDVEGTRSAIQVTQGRWGAQHGIPNWQGLMGAGIATTVAMLGSGDGGRAGNQGPIGWTPVVGSGKAYSVAAEVTLPPDAYPGLSREYHFQLANAELVRRMDADAAYAQGMRDIIPNLREQLVGPRGGISTEPPANWTWHHYAEPGVMQLVPRVQHQSSLLQKLFHPGGRGGYAIWGR